MQDDTIGSINETLQLAKGLNCEFVNFYCAMAYPGSNLYATALEKGLALPKNWTGYSQHSYDILPLASENLTAKQIVEFRDAAFHEYYKNPIYLSMIEKKFGTLVKKHIEEVTKTHLKRAVSAS